MLRQSGGAQRAISSATGDFLCLQSGLNPANCNIMRFWLDRLPWKTPQERWGVLSLVLAWGLLFLPNLGDNPNWYSDEGDILEWSWHLAEGESHSGAIRCDFLFPHPYPPLYLLTNGALLHVVGYDIVVSRAFQTVIAMVAALLLLWVGSRLRNHTFGLVAAFAFLLYPETVMNFRWVRPHPLAGTLALAAVGLLIRYLQGKQCRDVVWAGLLASLATATHYYAYPLLGVVVITALFVDRRHWFAAIVGAAAFPVVFGLWYVATQTGGFATMLEHARLAGGMAPAEPLLSQLVRVYRNLVSFCLTTPMLGPDRSFVGVDWWLVLASVGIIVFPVARFRKWLAFWLLAVMYPVFKQQDNLPIFFYPACLFLPILALGCAGTLTQLGDWVGERVAKDRPACRQALPAIVLAVFGLMSLAGAVGHFRTKVDPWTVRSPVQARATADFVNANTTSEDLVLVSKNINWLVRRPRSGSLTQALAYEGQTNEMYVLPISRKFFWTECDWRRAKFVVLSSGIAGTQEAIGFDLVYMRGLRGVADLVSQMLRDGWQVVHTTGSGTTTIPSGPNKLWPVAVNGEFLVLANPQLRGTLYK